MELFTIEEVSDILKVSTQTTRRLIKKGYIKAVVFGKTIRVTNEELHKFLTSRQG